MYKCRPALHFPPFCRANSPPFRFRSSLHTNTRRRCHADAGRRDYGVHHSHQLAVAHQAHLQGYIRDLGTLAQFARQLPALITC